MFSMPFAQNTLHAGQSQRKAFAAGGATAAQSISSLMPGVDTASTSHISRILYAHQLLGKSPEYIANYAQTGTTTGGSNSRTRVLIGCVIGGAIVGVIGAACLISIDETLSTLF